MQARRLAAVYAALLAGFAVVLCRLYLAASNTGYAARAAGQSAVTLRLPARRGNFYDCDGLPLTGLDETWYALCLPGESSYVRLYDTATAAGQAELYQRRNAASPFLLEVTQDVASLGVYTYPAARRYCAVPLCQHLIGYLDGEGRGVSGLEAALDEVLAGSGGQDTVTCTVTGQGRLVEGTGPVYTPAAFDGAGVQLTISRPIQRAAEAVAAETMTSGCILVLDVDTAQVRASVSLPGYDPDNIAASLDEAGSPLLDRTLAAYAVGSVFKPVLAAAALEAGLDGLTVECPGYTVVDGQVFRCASGTAHGTVDLAAALEKSCNGYFIRLGQELGAETVLEAARRLGFGQRVRVAGTLQGAAGVLPEAESLTPAGQLANFSFGQGQLLATPLQVAAMMNAIAAGGVYRAPSFLLRTLDEATGETQESASLPAARQVFLASTAQRLQKLLAGVVAEGTGREAAPLYGDAAGKTGTAQTGQFTASGEEKMNLWFAGFCPAGDPQYTVVVLQDGQTQPAHSSAAVFAQVCEALWLLEQ